MAFTQKAPAKMRTLFSSGRSTGQPPMGVRLSRALRVRERPDSGEFDTGGVAATPQPSDAGTAPMESRPAVPRVPLGRTPPGPNLGGTITSGGTTRTFAPSPYNAPRTAAGTPASPAALAPALPPALPPTMPAAIQPALPAVGGTPVASATTSNAQQTESANPLSGDGNAQPGATSDALKPGMALGVVQRGTSVPRGQDAQPSSNVGGTGLYRRTFTNPKSASIYDQYVRKLFSGTDVGAAEAASGASDTDDDGE